MSHNGSQNKVCEIVQLLKTLAAKVDLSFDPWYLWYLSFLKRRKPPVSNKPQEISLNIQMQMRRMFLNSPWVLLVQDGNLCEPNLLFPNNELYHWVT